MITARDKVLSFQQLESRLEGLRRDRPRIVFTNGCFDLLHIGHLRYLEEARSLGDLLIVGVNTDASVRKIKGDLKPVVPESERSELVAGLHCVDHVVLFDSPDPLALIHLVRPAVLVKGADWPVEGIVGADFVQSIGGRVARIALVPGRSSTAIIARIIDRFSARSR